MNKPSFSYALQRVLFDPLSYLHPQRLRLPSNLTACSTAREAVNDLLLIALRLEVEVGPVELTPLAKQWIYHWYRLPQTAYLIGCHYQRAELAWKGGLFSLPTWAGSFAALNLSTQVAKSAEHVVSHRELMKTGYAHLQLWNKQLPKALAQRLPLLFPTYVDTVTAQSAVDPLILTLALQHAQIYPNTPP